MTAGPAGPSGPTDATGRPRPVRSVGSVGASVAKAAGVIALVTLLARGVGFARTLVFSRSVGTTGVGDIYQTINVIPNVVYEVAAGGVLAAVAVPLIAHQLGLDRTDDADRTASALLSWAVVVLTPLSVLLVVLAPWLSGALLGDRASDEERTLGAHLLVLFAPQ
ncbi:MAG: lipid II flippase MurJ, partial [Pedococcus sp.]